MSIFTYTVTLYTFIYFHIVSYIHSYTFIYKFNILFTFIFFAAKRSVAKLPTAGALAAAVLDKPKKLTQAGSCLNHV